ncbi:acyltransferase [Woodsholea maritima]|uniref:acyltransferase n=1 Tax=Woodsholea maritima TaxID=240237 RepID=UPI0004778192|nr:acyltransferase [Woodsholea maritima]
MRKDHRPYWMHSAWESFENAWARHFVHPHFDSIGPKAKMVRPWNIEIFGPNIHVGQGVHIVSRRDQPVSFTLWAPPERDAHIRVGDSCFFAGGVRILAAGAIEIGDGALLAKAVTITDCDWHGLYNRVDPAPPFKPVKIGHNVWIGDGAFIGKGVTIGDHAVIGARSVITKDVPAYAVVAGSPQRVIKTLDPNGPFKTRMDFMGDMDGLDRFMDQAYRDNLRGNSTLGWLRTKLWPKRGD